LKGAVQVTKSVRSKGHVALRTLKPGDFFGEMSFFSGKKRTASCQVLQPAVVLQIPYAKFKKLLKSCDATAYKLINTNCHLLAERLDHILELIGDDSFATSVDNPVFRRKLKFFWSV